MNILVTGATGYVGGRLTTRLIEKKYNVRVMARDISRLDRRWDEAEYVYGDALDSDSLGDALNGIDAAYYLIHSMGSGEEFSARDLKAAENFAGKAEAAGVKRIIYLGGLGSSNEVLSKHLKSRQETGDKLREFGVPVTEFRAGVIVGSGSLSFEMIRYLTERVVVMVTPKWVDTKTQPIAIRDVLAYLIETLEIPETTGQIIEIGGRDILSYKDLMKIYADVRGLKRYFIGVPFLTPRLSSHWIGLVTPLPSKIAKPLVDGLKYELTCTSNIAHDLFNIEPISYRKAVELAFQRQKEGHIETIWSGAYSSLSGKDLRPVTLTQKEGMFIEKREVIINAPRPKVFKTVSRIGGKNGWFANFLWQLRGLIDRMIGGVGMRRGRRSDSELLPGDPLDFWRVEKVEPDQLIRLRAEMKLPGNAWLQFEIESIDENKTHLIQTAFFEPKGLWGVIYWYSIYFLHGYIFGGMIKDLKNKAES